jgi:hypothetical protein
MALLKLWNSLLGRSATESLRPQQSAQPSLDERAAKDGSEVSPKLAEKPAVKKPAQRLSLFGSASPHAALLKQLRGVDAESVLEISVGDGSRAVEVLAFLNENRSKNSDEEIDPSTIRYAAIDQFEMGGGDYTLVQFHQTLRSAGIRPQVFPEAIDRGLTRVAHTIGSTDLIVIGADSSIWETPTIKTLLSRVTHDQSLILFQKDDSWQKLALSELGSKPVYRRAA